MDRVFIPATLWKWWQKQALVFLRLVQEEHLVVFNVGCIETHQLCASSENAFVFFWNIGNNIHLDVCASPFAHMMFPQKQARTGWCGENPKGCLWFYQFFGCFFLVLDARPRSGRFCFLDKLKTHILKLWAMTLDNLIPPQSQKSLCATKSWQADTRKVQELYCLWQLPPPHQLMVQAKQSTIAIQHRLVSWPLKKMSFCCSGVMLVFITEMKAVVMCSTIDLQQFRH